MYPIKKFIRFNYSLTKTELRLFSFVRFPVSQYCTSTRMSRIFEMGTSWLLWYEARFNVLIHGCTVPCTIAFMYQIVMLHSSMIVTPFLPLFFSVPSHFPSPWAELDNDCGIIASVSDARDHRWLECRCDTAVSYFQCHQPSLLAAY